MTKYIVTVTNGLGMFDQYTWKKSDWVYDKTSAKKITESKINNAWEVIKVEEVEGKK